MVQHYGLIDQHPIALGAGHFRSHQLGDRSVRAPAKPIDDGLVFDAFFGGELPNATVPLPQSGFYVLPMGGLNEHV